MASTTSETEGLGALQSGHQPPPQKRQVLAGYAGWTTELSLGRQSFMGSHVLTGIRLVEIMAAPEIAPGMHNQADREH